MRAPRICIIGLEDYGLLTNEVTTEYVGGETVQHVLLARAWRALGVDVSIIVFDHGQGRVRDIDGIRAIAAYPRDAGIPGLRFVHPRMTHALAAMREADADIYYQSLAGVLTGLTAWFCQRHDKRFVFRISSDAYCVPGQQLIRLRRDRTIYEYGLNRADLIVAQTEHQRRLLRRHYGLESELANMTAEVPAGRGGQKDIDVLWVSNFRAVKRPELAIDLARRLPHLRFVLVGGGEEDYGRRMRAAAADLPNVELTGPIAYSAVGAYFDRARIFLNTSSLEGFPNTFLQAWVRGVPVVTFFDPDGLVARRGLGVAVQDLEQMATSIVELTSRDDIRAAVGARAAQFAAEQYSMPSVARSYLDLFTGHFGPMFSAGRVASGCLVT